MAKRSRFGVFITGGHSSRGRPSRGRRPGRRRCSAAASPVRRPGGRSRRSRASRVAAGRWRADHGGSPQSPTRRTVDVIGPPRSAVAAVEPGLQAGSGRHRAATRKVTASASASTGSVSSKSPIGQPSRRGHRAGAVVDRPWLLGRPAAEGDLVGRRRGRPRRPRSRWRPCRCRIIDWFQGGSDSCQSWQVSRLGSSRSEPSTIRAYSSCPAETSAHQAFVNVRSAATTSG